MSGGSRVAWVFGGQGSQFTAMGQGLVQRSAAAREVFAAASDRLGYDLRRVIDEDPGQLALTAVSQPAILALEIAALRTLQTMGQCAEPTAVAGHSLGEFTALVAANSLALVDAVALVAERGRLMQDAAPVGTGAVSVTIGLDVDVVERACLECSQDGEIVVPANYNHALQTVVSGHARAVARCSEQLKALGARVIALQLSVPVHSPLMEPARVRFAKVLADMPLRSSEVPWVANASGEIVTEPPAIREALAQQLSGPVRWRACVRKLEALGVSQVLELSPRPVLGPLIAAEAPAVSTLFCGDPGAVDSCTIAAWLRTIVGTPIPRWSSVDEAELVRQYRELSDLADKAAERPLEEHDAARARSLASALLSAKGLPLGA